MRTCSLWNFVPSQLVIGRTRIDHKVRDNRIVNYTRINAVKLAQYQKMKRIVSSNTGGFLFVFNSGHFTHACTVNSFITQ